ncbi:MAG: DUF2341 domain-containing protein [Spirochaetales bacterium]|nr:DUF2341 domain-containing protein [Spirochaetales bacterium]
MRRPLGAGRWASILVAAGVLLLATCSPYGAWDLLGMRALVQFPEYGRVLPMELDNGGQSETLLDFPLLVTLTPGRFQYAYADPAGADLRFVTGDGETTLAHEIEEWNQGGTSRVWVLVPRIPGGGTAEIALLYAGPAGGVPEAPAEIWAAYELVYHLTDLTLNSGSNPIQGSEVGAPSSAAGRIAGGVRTSSAGDHIDTNYTADPVLRDSWTVEAWVQGDAAPVGGVGTTITGPVMGGLTFNISWDHDANNLSPAAYGNDGTKDTGAKFGGGLSGSTWYYLVGVYDGAVLQLRAHMNGAQVEVNTEMGSQLEQSVSDALIGTLDGIVDEVRISAEVRSADWIRAQYLSMTDALITYGETLTR